MFRYLFESSLNLAGRPLNCAFNIFDPPVIVLTCHRVIALQSDPEMLAVTPDNFRAHMRHLKETVPVVRFEDDWSKIRRPAVSITFDDGYADNVLEALPIIEEVGVPTTFFVSTANIGTQREFWRHELERIIMGDWTFPERFNLHDGRFGRRWQTSTPAGRDALYREIHALMMQVDPVSREEWLMQLRKWARAGETGREEYRAMTYDELRRLAGRKWATVGAHTVTHTPLSAPTEDQQREEIDSSKLRLETLLGTRISVFSYPFGGKSDYDNVSVRICREAGFIKAASNFPGQAPLLDRPPTRSLASLSAIGDRIPLPPEWRISG